MNKRERARQAVRDTQHLAGIVSDDVRVQMAIARVAIVVAGMDDSIHAAVRIMRLEDGIAIVREMLAA